MIKQDFILTTIEGSHAYILTEFEFIVKGLVEKGYSISSLEDAFNRGIEISKAEKKDNDKIIKKSVDDEVKNLLKTIDNFLGKLGDEIEGD